MIHLRIFNKLKKSVRKRRDRLALSIRSSYVPQQIKNAALKALDPSKDSVMIVSHAAGRTGAPILALNIAQQLNKKYNVITLLLNGGALLPDFQKHSAYLIDTFSDAYDLRMLPSVLEELLSEIKPKFAIVNSIASREVLPIIANHYVPSLCLVHEFALNTYRPRNAVSDVVLWASRVVFSAEIVHQDNASQCEALRAHGSPILAQGKCVIPLPITSDNDEINTRKISKLLRPEPFPDTTVVIIGAGYVDIRKGVDIFLSCAARVLELKPRTAFRFVWVGDGFDPDTDLGYSVYLQDQINRAGLAKHFCFTGEIADIETVYKLSDVLFLSSRLDPLPNVAIDSMFAQIPVICFDGTTGIADILKQNGLGEACVIPYLNFERAARRMVELIDDAAQRKTLGAQIQLVGKREFDMQSYVKALERHALDCAAIQCAERLASARIEESRVTDLEFFSPPGSSTLSHKQAARTFVRSWTTAVGMRKPFPGFHPGIFSTCHGSTLPAPNPLVAFLDEGMPTGPWLCALIEPTRHVQLAKLKTLRVALHLHVFFVDLVPEILARLNGQNLGIDLLISVPSTDVARKIEALVGKYAKGTVVIRIVPNRGRDIGPLLTEFGRLILQDYDIIGHVHTKKSIDVKDAGCVRQWVTFLLENLIGGKYPMASTILERMCDDGKLGLVYPDDPNVIGWSDNKKIAREIADRMGMGELPECHFNFPVGTMFWARTGALKPLISLGLGWDDYPAEPLPYDGTMLHAIERLIPFVVKNMGYETSLTHVPGVTR